MNTLFYQPDLATEHLSPDLWQKVNLQLLQKMLSEFSHEMLLEPQLIAQRGEWSVYAVEHVEKDVQYHFLARVLSLDHWDIDALSIIKIHKGSQMPLDAVQFVVEFAEQLGLEQENIGTYIEEVISVLFTYCYMHNKNTTAVEDLVHADYQDIEHSMSAGHPCFVANSARIGFDAIDYQNYAPEAADPLAIVWLAGHCDCTEFSSIADSSYEKMIKQELDEERIGSFNQNLLSKDLDPKDYYYFPVHPWQWFNKLAHIFAADIANQKLICLGYADDLYLPQQSVRTLFNVDNRSRSYVKSALSILNMGFMRGLSPNFMRTTPAINTWVYDLVIHDDYLQRKGFTVLREFATVGYTNFYFEEALHIDTPYKKMLSTLWRESPFLYVNEEQQMMTMAALLHIDVYGNAFLPTLIKASGLSVQDWLRHYLNCYLSPLLHCYYFHDMRFMPHGENLILVMENHIPVKVIMKDIGEEVAVLSPDVSLPLDVERIRIPVPEDLKILSIFTQAFDCFFRFLNQVLVSYADFPEEQFWQTVSECILAYQQEFPSLEDRFNRYDLFAAEIPKTCLNRLQLRNNKKMIDGANPFKHQQFAGNLKNPLAVYKTTLI
ncbi:MULTISPECIES: IucA/IucC family siderophore biosynthesis protein [unclassified Sphingobacterium]|uniref:IucA/IucC family protein n=1 Tax=unclassified Sphingobacterium TaxID=2609468 RepID=UPI00104C0376|nr:MULTISPECIES: IucA/IucC family siderophore biosynthesis protein [unclassified Sphingobacterium]MCS3556578.1 siderophore synthetase component [Sphingobacterium sp. JUb21]TCQ99872.1 siderophore synthetase component [Sphingobacterium sp. JUb20]